MPIYRLTHTLAFPPPHLAEDGLLAVGGDLSRDRLLLAYRHGIFPWYSEDEPILWWSPDPRMVLFPGKMHVSRSLRKVLRQGRFSVTLDRAFPEVIKACAGIPRQGQEGTWITPEMIQAYIDLFAAGYGHSIEVWREGILAGGLYGLSLGACFCGESMFSRENNASKTAMAVLCGQLAAWGIEFLDCQVANPHLARLGAREIPREAFLRLLRQGLQKKTRRGRWVLDVTPENLY